MGLFFLCAGMLVVKSFFKVYQKIFDLVQRGDYFSIFINSLRIVFDEFFRSFQGVALILYKVMDKPEVFNISSCEQAVAFFILFRFDDI